MCIMFLERVRLAFSEYPAQQKVAEKMLSLGLGVRNGVVICGEAEVKEVSLAKACGVDRRVVGATISRIPRDAFLDSVFSNLQPAGPLFLQNASALGLCFLEIEPPSASKSGIIADITRVLAENRVSIRQILSQDPELFESPKLFIVLPKKPPAKVLSALTNLKCVKRLSVS